MKKRKEPVSARTRRRSGRRSPLASVALIAAGLLLTGGAYAAISASPSANAQAAGASQSSVENGAKLFAANCATCHGMALQGTKAGPSLVGVGAAAVDFQVGTGRMPLQNSGPQAPRKPVQFTPADVKSLADYVASMGAGPGIPDPQYLQGNGDAARGQRLFVTNCAMCHNVAGAGGALTQGKYAPSLAGVDAQKIYEAMVTGPQNMPVFSDANLSPQDKADIITALKYKQNNPSPGGFDLGNLGPVSEGLFLWIFGLGAIVALTVWLTARSN